MGSKPCQEKGLLLGREETWKAEAQNLREGWGRGGPLQSLRDSLPN